MRLSARIIALTVLVVVSPLPVLAAEDDWVYLPSPVMVPQAARAQRPQTKWWETSGLRALQAAGHCGEGVCIAVVDTGIDPSHPAFTGAFVIFADFTQDVDCPTCIAAYEDIGHGHGVTSAAAGRDPAHPELWGAAPACKLLVAKVFEAGARPRAHWRWIVSAIDWAVEQGAQVINLSLGTLSSSTRHPIMEAVQRACDAGVYVVCAAGNEAFPVIVGPGVVLDAVTVGACTANGGLVSWSNIGPELDCLAWGVSVPVAAADCIARGRRYEKVTLYMPTNGTSFAAPIVAGLLADLIAAGVKDPVRALLDGCRDLGKSAEKQGAGMVDARGAAREARIAIVQESPKVNCGLIGLEALFILGPALLYRYIAYRRQWPT